MMSFLLDLLAVLKKEQAYPFSHSHFLAEDVVAGSYMCVPHDDCLAILTIGPTRLLDLEL